MEKLATGYGLVEGPVWDPDNGLLYSDVFGGGVYCVSQSGEITKVFAHRRGIGGMAMHERGGLVVSGRNISWKSVPEGETVTLLEREDPGGDKIGFNDLTADAAGRIYVGSLGASPFDAQAKPQSGDLYVIDLDGSSRIVAEDIRLTNGLAFSPDNQWLYHSDSKRQHVNRYAVLDNGDLGSKEVHIEVQEGVPDGLVVSEDGRIWIAQAGGHGVGVYQPDGSFERLIEIAQPMCTSVCFGGDDLTELYIVSGSEGSGDNSGSVYKTQTDAKGLPVYKAKVSF